MDNEDLLITTADAAQVNVQGYTYTIDCTGSDANTAAESGVRTVTLDSDTYTVHGIDGASGPELRTDIAWEDLEEALRRGARITNDAAAAAATFRVNVEQESPFYTDRAEPDTVMYDMNGFDTDGVMQLDDGAKVRVGIQGMPDLRLSFAGYFSEADLEKVVSGYIGDSDAGIVQETRAVVFRYKGDVVAVKPDHYYTEVCFDTMEDGVHVRYLRPQAVRFVTRPGDLCILWHAEDGTVATGNALTEMDRAFDEVFQ